MRDLLLVLCLSMGGCTATGIHVKPVLTGDPVQNRQFQRINNTLIARRKQINSYRGLSRSLFIEDDVRSLARHAIVYKAPDSVRIELLAPGAAYAVQVLAVSAGKGAAYDASSQEAFVGSIDSAVMQRLLGMSLAPEELVQYLFGRLPDSFTAAAGLKARCLMKEFSCQLYQEGFALYAELNGASGQLQKVILRDSGGGRVKLVFEYSEHVSLGALDYPRRVRVKIIDADAEISLRFTVAKFNVPANEDLFSIAVPDGYKIHR